MPSPSIRVEDTPNPHALKFIADRSLTPGGTLSFRSPAEADAAENLFAQALFALGPVTSVMIVGDFVTVNKNPSARWPKLQPQVEAVLREHLTD